MVKVLEGTNLIIEFGMPKKSRGSSTNVKQKIVFPIFSTICIRVYHGYCINRLGITAIFLHKVLHFQRLRVIGLWKSSLLAYCGHFFKVLESMQAKVAIIRIR